MNSIGLQFTSLVRRIVVRMSSTNSRYEDAIRKLNSLQSNKSTIEQIKKGLKTGQKCTNIEDMVNYLNRVGISLSRLDQLSVIHVAGTKGKGSTSAMCESILRRHGFRTGFYSSPHLVAARERIRLDGQPLSEDDFAETLHHVYGMLWDTQEYEGDMPKYFAFLTVCAFHEFLRRRVDVAVVEVGIGGIVDYTNVLRKVPVVGITALGLDHTSILGNTLQEIAAAKAGVMKRGCDAYTVPQPLAAHDVLRQYADTVKCPLTVVPDYKTYAFAAEPHLPVDLDAYKTNASLAIQLAHAWMRQARLTNVKKEISVINNFGPENGVKNEFGKESGVKNGLVIENAVKNGFRTENGVKNEEVQVNFVTNGNVLMNKLKKDVINDKLPGSILSYKRLDCVSNGSMMNDIMTNGNTGKLKNGMTNKSVINDGTLKNKIMTNGNIISNKFEYSKINISSLENGVTNGGVLTNKYENGISNNKNLTNDTIQTSQFKYGSSNFTRLENGMTNGKVMENDVTNRNVIGNDVTNVKISEDWFTNGVKLENGLTNVEKLVNGVTNGNILGKVICQVPLPTVQGLSQCRWPGRYQVIDAGFASFYLDGAHTKESMEICAQWFLDNNSTHIKSLIFTATGDRNAATLLQPLTNIPFKHIYFVNPTAHAITYKNHDNYSLIEQQELEERCQKHAQIWREKNQTTQVDIFDCVSDALQDIKEKGNKQSVLVTGSLHLVGAALSILDPSLRS